MPCFSPARSEQERRARQHQARQTPLVLGNRPGTNRASMPIKKAGSRYTSASYRRAVIRACETAFGMPDYLRQIPRELDEDRRRELRAAASSWRKSHCWSPNQLRHSAATEIRNAFGIEAAQVVLGHASLSVTEIYAERDLALAASIARKLG